MVAFESTIFQNKCNAEWNEGKDRVITHIENKRRFLKMLDLRDLEFFHVPIRDRYPKVRMKYNNILNVI